jgi:hypothetical protein
MKKSNDDNSMKKIIIDENPDHLHIENLNIGLDSK